LFITNSTSSHYYYVVPPTRGAWKHCAAPKAQWGRILKILRINSVPLTLRITALIAVCSIFLFKNHILGFFLKHGRTANDRLEKIGFCHLLCIMLNERRKGFRQKLKSGHDRKLAYFPILFHSLDRHYPSWLYICFLSVTTVVLWSIKCQISNWRQVLKNIMIHIIKLHRYVLLSMRNENSTCYFFRTISDFLLSCSLAMYLLLTSNRLFLARH